MTLATRIDPTRLNSVRRARKFGRPRLAKLTGITERQLGRLESTGSDAGEGLPVGLLERIATALQVAPEVLTGEAPVTEADLYPAINANTCRTGCCG